MGVGIRGTLGDIDPLKKVPFKRARSRVQKVPFYGVSLGLPRNKPSKMLHEIRQIERGDTSCNFPPCKSLNFKTP